MSMLHSVSFVIPTYNCADSLAQCLDSICAQKYDRELIEIIIVDGESTDNTRKIAQKFGALIINNPKRSHPEGRPLGINRAKGEIVALVDSDNILPSNDWLERMVLPFDDTDIVATEPLYYVARKKDNVLTQYCTLIGADDPIAVAIGFYDRFSYLTNTWTTVPHTETQCNGYRKVVFADSRMIPSLGANGTLIRKDMLKTINIIPFYHVGIAAQLIKAGFNIWAKVDVGIIHMQKGTLATFLKKKWRRIERRCMFKKNMGYQYPITKRTIIGVCLTTILIVPLFIETFIGCFRKPNLVWILHPFLHIVVFGMYATTSVKRIFIARENEFYEYV